jgi:hypothetical protein
MLSNSSMHLRWCESWDYRSGGDPVMAEEIERSPEEIERAVRRLMDGGNKARKKVKDMGEMARKVVMDGGSSFTSIGQLIEDMIGSS